MMNKNSLSLADPRGMSMPDMLRWLKTQADLSAKKCADAHEFYKNVERHHNNLSELMAMAVEIEEGKRPAEEDEMEAIGDAVLEIITSLNEISKKEGLQDNSVPLEDFEGDIQKEPAFAKAQVELEKDQKSFLERYMYHKNRLGLKTQLEVANRTGLDRRYISLIERGKHKPQFKTIQKLAQGFGVEIKELTGEGD